MEVLRLAAFADGAGGGNPAGVVLDAQDLRDEDMLAIAAEVGYAETAFVTGSAPGAPPSVAVRYFSPVAEVPFCGHATVAIAVVLAERDGPAAVRFETAAGPFDVATHRTGTGVLASFTSPEPVVAPLDEQALSRLLELLGLHRADLDPDAPPRSTWTGNVHPVVVLADRAVFDGFAFDGSALRALMLEQGWLATVTVLHRTAPEDVEARNLFPVGTMDEDPATGSAAAATGAYLRAEGLIPVPSEVRIRQGRHVGRPSLLRVEVPATGGVTVTGGATRIAP